MLIQNGKRNTPPLTPQERAIQRLLTGLDLVIAACADYLDLEDGRVHLHDQDEVNLYEDVRGLHWMLQGPRSLIEGEVLPHVHPIEWQRRRGRNDAELASSP